MARYFSLPRLKEAIEHLEQFDSKWVIVPLVFAVNEVNDTDEVRVQGTGKAGTDRFLDLYFNGSVIGLPDFDNGANTMRPRFSEIWHPGDPDYVIHQRQKLWGNQYSRNGYNIMVDRGLVHSSGPSRFSLDQSFWAEWGKQLPERLSLRAPLVWLYAFRGFDEGIDTWEKLLVDFQGTHLPAGQGFLPGTRNGFE